MWLIVKPFLVAVVSVSLFTLLVALSGRYKDHTWSRFLLWAGILCFLIGCYFFGTTVIALPEVPMYLAIGVFAVLFAGTAGYLAIKRRRD